jgi:hypothetical protein
MTGRAFEDPVSSEKLAGFLVYNTFGLALALSINGEGIRRPYKFEKLLEFLVYNTFE